MHNPDLWKLYRQMLYCRFYEEAVAKLWDDGLISGEMHLGTGEEAIIAGVMDHLQEGDALALDHRGTAAMLLRGVDPVLILRELLGYENGLCSGRGGHMHLYSREHLAASSGIVGASGPAALGFALTAQIRRTENLSIAFFGEGAMNQGMLLESINLAVVWALPVLFVCKDDQWAITSRSSKLSASDPEHRARGLGILTRSIKGWDVERVWYTAREATEHIRSGKGPFFLHAQCLHLEGHFLGDALLRLIRHPVREGKKIALPLLKSLLKSGGAGFKARAESMISMSSLISENFRNHRSKTQEPLKFVRNKLINDMQKLEKLEQEMMRKVRAILEEALIDPGGG